MTGDLLTVFEYRCRRCNKVYDAFEERTTGNVFSDKRLNDHARKETPTWIHGRKDGGSGAGDLIGYRMREEE